MAALTERNILYKSIKRLSEPSAIEIVQKETFFIIISLYNKSAAAANRALLRC